MEVEEKLQAKPPKRTWRDAAKSEEKEKRKSEKKLKTEKADEFSCKVPNFYRPIHPQDRPTAGQPTPTVRSGAEADSARCSRLPVVLAGTWVRADQVAPRRRCA